jgi:hypothetical protein
MASAWSKVECFHPFTNPKPGANMGIYQTNQTKPRTKTMTKLKLAAMKLYFVVGSVTLFSIYMWAMWSIVFSPRINPSVRVGYPTQQMLKK